MNPNDPDLLPLSGPPEPYEPSAAGGLPRSRRGKRILCLVRGLEIFVLSVGAGSVFLASVTVHRTSGAVRSARLHWIEREAEIEQVIQAQQTLSAEASSGDVSPAMRSGRPNR